ncbi:hypothetical protein [Sphingomonas alpina]|uniref:Uncharacterized protein n=1 Tax=Sphingomonas alpina TaxID=653931 RepID=A0A7H0LHM0_9SPHN|nr:hypothetical protein [Sphingomonas alpina]QNQ09173.1 hypothetical protein H3Z74_21255 [Sphingomonas alpina]
MILGLSIPAFTQLHTIISLIGIATGLVFLVALLRGRWLAGWNVAFLVTTILTSVTGFFFPITAIAPPHIVGAISLAVLAVSLVALYGYKRAGIWRPVYAVTAVIALYFNVFVLIVQMFQKIPFLNALAPNQTEPPFALAQGLALLFFAWAGWRVVRRPA